MADFYIAEIRPFAGMTNRVPAGWHLCDGTLLPISGYETLYSLIGIAFGGDGITNFALPDLRGRLPLGSGRGAELVGNYAYASHGGTETVTLTSVQTPAHTHAFQVSTAAATSNAPANNRFADPAPNSFYATTKTQGSQDQVLGADTVSTAGAGQAHPNCMPTLAINYMIALVGIYPQRP
ncbi:phage tail protein [Methylomonas methanica]|uniref:Tail Collar domain protein n=1 Tax=Methylomonas methanica (strain DSM 25384 / MC09) TaxID=857087 RepID=F9ZVK4_METMM|nr:tail fiber protein [Methylomonas methanica]AEG01986.1 Tail Collar domain protein [Methylomonas methanica MC09]